jgi:hypothetical protein
MALMIRKSDQLGAPVSAKAAQTYVAAYRGVFGGGCVADAAQVLKAVREADVADVPSLYRRLQLAPPDLPE